MCAADIRVIEAFIIQKPGTRVHVTVSVLQHLPGSASCGGGFELFSLKNRSPGIQNAFLLTGYEIGFTGSPSLWRWFGRTRPSGPALALPPSGGRQYLTDGATCVGVVGAGGPHEWPPPYIQLEH